MRILGLLDGYTLFHKRIECYVFLFLLVATVRVGSYVMRGRIHTRVWGNRFRG